MAKVDETESRHIGKMLSTCNQRQKNAMPKAAVGKLPHVYDQQLENLIRMAEDKKTNLTSPEQMTTLRQEKVICVSECNQNEAKEKGEVELPIVSLENFKAKECTKNFQFGIKVAGTCKIQTELTATLKKSCTSPSKDVLIEMNGTESELNKIDCGMPIRSTEENLIDEQEIEYTEINEEMTEKGLNNEEEGQTESQQKESLEDENQSIKEKRDLPDMEKEEIQMMGRAKRQKDDKKGFNSAMPVKETNVLLFGQGCTQVQMEVSENEKQINLDLWLGLCKGECKKIQDPTRIQEEENRVENEVVTATDAQSVEETEDVEITEIIEVEEENLNAETISNNEKHTKSPEHTDTGKEEMQVLACVDSEGQIVSNGETKYVLCPEFTESLAAGYESRDDDVIIEGLDGVEEQPANIDSLENEVIIEGIDGVEEPPANIDYSGNEVIIDEIVKEPLIMKCVQNEGMIGMKSDGEYVLCKGSCTTETTISPNRVEGVKNSDIIEESIVTPLPEEEHRNVDEVIEHEIEEKVESSVQEGSEGEVTDAREIEQTKEINAEDAVKEPLVMKFVQNEGMIGMKSDGGCKGSCATETTTDTLLESFVTPLQKEEHRTVVIEHDEIEEKVESSVQAGSEGEVTDAKEIDTIEIEQSEEINTEDTVKEPLVMKCVQNEGMIGMKSDGEYVLCEGSCTTETTTFPNRVEGVKNSDIIEKSIDTPFPEEEHRNVDEVIEHEIEEKVESSVQEGSEGEVTDAKEIEQTKEINAEDAVKEPLVMKFVQNEGMIGMKSDGGCKGSCATETTTDTLLESFVTPLQKEEHRTVVIEHDEIEEKVESSVQEGGEGEATDAKEIETNENEQTKEIITEDKTKDQFSREKDQTKFEESAAKKESEKCPDYVERDSEKATRNEDANVCTGICATESNMEITPSMIQQAFQYLSVIVEEKCQQSELRTLKSKEISKVLQYCLKYLECTGICGPTQNDALLQREVEIKDDDYGADTSKQMTTSVASKPKSAREESTRGYSIVNIRTRASTESITEMVMSWAGGNVTLVDVAIRNVSKTQTELKVEAWTPVLPSSRIVDTKTSNRAMESESINEPLTLHEDPLLNPVSWEEESLLYKDVVPLPMWDTDLKNEMESLPIEQNNQDVKLDLDTWGFPTQRNGITSEGSFTVSKRDIPDSNIEIKSHQVTQAENSIPLTDGPQLNTNFDIGDPTTWGPDYANSLLNSVLWKEEPLFFKEVKMCPMWEADLSNEENLQTAETRVPEDETIFLPMGPVLPQLKILSNFTGKQSPVLVNIPIEKEIWGFPTATPQRYDPTSPDFFPAPLDIFLHGASTAPQDFPSPGQLIEPSILFTIIMNEDISETRIKTTTGKPKEDNKDFVFQYEDSIEINEMGHKSYTHAMQFYSSETDTDKNNTFNTEVVLTLRNCDNVRKVFGFKSERFNSTIETLPVFVNGLGDQYKKPENVPESAVLTNFNFKFKPNEGEIVSSEMLFIECCKLGMKTTFILTLKESSNTARANNSNAGEVTHQIINNGIESAQDTNIIGPERAPVSIIVPLGTAGQGLMKVSSESQAGSLLTSHTMHISTSDGQISETGAFYSAYVDGKEKSEVKNLLPGDAPLLIQMPFGRPASQGIPSCVPENQLSAFSPVRFDPSGLDDENFPTNIQQSKDPELLGKQNLELLEEPISTANEKLENKETDVCVKVCNCKTGPASCKCRTKAIKSRNKSESSPDKTVALTDEQFLAEMLRPDVEYPPPVGMIVPLKYDGEQQKLLGKPPSRFGNINSNFLENISKVAQVIDDNFKTDSEHPNKVDIEKCQTLSQTAKLEKHCTCKPVLNNKPQQNLGTDETENNKGLQIEGNTKPSDILKDGIQPGDVKEGILGENEEKNALNQKEHTVQTSKDPSRSVVNLCQCSKRKNQYRGK